MAGLAPITGHDIESWQRLNGQQLTAWERATLRHLDTVAREATATPSNRAPQGAS